MPDLKELIERLERATGPDRQLERDILSAIFPEKWKKSQSPIGVVSPEDRVMFRDVGTFGWDAAPFTSSIDAALTLVPEGYGWRVDWRSQVMGKAWASCGKPEMREDMVKIGSGLNKVASLAYRGQFTNWAFKIKARFNPEVLTPDALAFIIHEGDYPGLDRSRRLKSYTLWGYLPLQEGVPCGCLNTSSATSVSSLGLAYRDWRPFCLPYFSALGGHRTGYQFALPSTRSIGHG